MLGGGTSEFQDDHLPFEQKKHVIIVLEKYNRGDLKLLSVKRRARELGGALSGVEPPPSKPRGVEPCPVLAGGQDDDILSEVQ